MKVLALRRADRFAGAALAILVQGGFLALLIFSRSPIRPPERLVRELTWLLPQLAAPKVPSAPTTIDARGAPRRAKPQAVATPTVTTPPVSAPAAPPDLRNLGQSLFGCAPETWSSLTPEQRARCPRPGEGVAIQDAPDLLHPPASQAKDSDHWKAELASRKSIRLPCTYVGTHALFPDPNAVMVDPMCLPGALKEFFHKVR